jgi:radical SAM protein with 4Fe4S-binding SPASM domain
MKTIDYQEFSFRLHQKAFSQDKRIPVNVTLELTYRCNNRCVHCYCNLPASDKEAEQKELNMEEIERLFDELQHMGTLWLLLTGGEPLLRKDFKEIYLSAKRHGFLITVFTNATLVDDEIVELFKAYPPFVVEVTMYGATEETYERVTRVKGSYRNYWEGLNRLLKAGIKVKTKAMVLTINQHEIKMLHRLSKELGCHFRFDPLLHKRIDDRKYSSPEKYRISIKDVVRLDLDFPERLQEYEEFCEKLVGKVVSGSDRLIGCGAGKFSLHIAPDGKVMPCSMLCNMDVSLREKPLKNIWETDIKELIFTKKDFSLECDECPLLNLCGQCVGWSLLEYGRMDKKVEYLCRVAHTRAETFPFLNNNF